MATHNDTPISVSDLRQHPNIGTPQTLLKGREDQAVTLLRVLVAFADGDVSVNCNLSAQIDFYRQNLRDFAEAAKAVLAPPKEH